MSIRALQAMGLVALLASGCAATAPVGSGAAAQASATSRDPVCAPYTAEQELLVSLSQEMVGEGRLHAALANLEQLPAGIADVQLRMAQILRHIDAQRAKGLYRGLLNGPCFEAEANHGLGQIAAEEGYHREAQGHLRVAAKLAPADQSIRNDLGLVYLHLRRIDEARFELMTALELGEGDTQAAQNLLTLLLYQDQWEQASALIEGKHLSPQQFESAQALARQLQEEDGKAPNAEVGASPASKAIPLNQTNPARS
jgi:Flp pilus assembly protein TadD